VIDDSGVPKCSETDPSHHATWPDQKEKMSSDTEMHQRLQKRKTNIMKRLEMQEENDRSQLHTFSIRLRALSQALARLAGDLLRLGAALLFVPVVGVSSSTLNFSLACKTSTSEI
jgi:hypothetical protein